MKFGTWNVRTLTDNPNSNRPERRTAILAQDLRRFDIDIATRSETRRAGEGQLKEHSGGYTFFWKGKPEAERCFHGIGFAVKNELVDRLKNSPCGVTERLMTLRITLSRNQCATVISVYAPTLNAMDEAKEDIYSNLETSLSRVPAGDKLILLGDFNARVSKDTALWGGVIGREGVGKANSSGTLLLTKCLEHELLITNTLFRQRDKYKASWQHPRSKHWHLLDYVIVRARDRKDVRITRVDDCWTDHR
uniref:craniofacial development protein 2-like n=1 Tax=Pristiophorus japonicus TaxID=55135 RepID=UPI00398F4583